MTVAVATALFDYPTYPVSRALTAPNLRRFDIPDASSFPWTGIIRDLDDLVERVMKTHQPLSH